MQPEWLSVQSVATPLGETLVVTDAEGHLRAFDFHDYAPRMRRLLRLHYGNVDLRDGEMPRVIRQSLDAYFAGDLQAVESIVCVTGGTAFQRDVWRALRGIPPGTTLTYGALARQLGAPAASRAVGLANGSNPIAIVVPCHRVIGASGALTGYAGGVHRKQWLLEHEGVLPRSMSLNVNESR